MSGLDGLGWPNPEDEPKPNKTMNSQLEIKLAPTPESDKAKIAFTSLFANDDAYWIPYKVGIKLERERDEARNGWADEIRKGQAELRNAEQLYNEAVRERDEARETCSELVTDSDAITLAQTVVRITQERNRYQESADALVDRLGATQERMINAERICNKIYIARNITHSEESMLSAIAEIDKIYRTKNDGN